MILPIPIIGVHKSPAIDYIVQNLGKDFEYCLSAEENYRYQEVVDHEENNSGGVLTTTKRFVLSPPEHLRDECKKLHDFLKPCLPQIRDYLVSLQKTLDDLSNNKDLRSILEEQLSNTKLTPDTEKLFLVIANEAALDNEIYSELLPVYEKLENYNPVELLYLISDTIRKIRREKIKFYLGGQNQSLNKHPRL